MPRLKAVHLSSLKSLCERSFSPDFLKSAVEAMIKIEQAKKGEQLLNQLSQMTNEIDKRVIVVEAIQRIYEDKATDELHTLHPLVLRIFICICVLSMKDCSCSAVSILFLHSRVACAEYSFYNSSDTRELS